ncbi:hypothetical protein KEH51_15700 [[Brevibacterium] frigoritolerans]|uniref:Uncharacterized protein n=1 Tax=Peribacillus frigoritolerans TaxID=450367 RepID=A0A941JAW6_9BACI|nr:hypothetical protein [Peribacillus frigoritolerans]
MIFEKSLYTEEYIHLVTPFLQCRCCGTGYESREHHVKKSSFDESFRVYTQHDISNYLDVDIEEMAQYAEKYYINLRKVEITNFSTF